MSVSSASELRRALKQALPPEAFEPQPWRGIAALLAFAATVAAAVVVVVTDLPWPVDLLLSIGIGQGIASVGLAAHESMHGAVFKSRAAQWLLAWVGFGPLLVTPGLWTAWHIRAHHRGANQTDYDPDILSTVDEYQQSWTTRVRAQLFPGSGHWLSVIGFFTLFSVEGQFFLWAVSGKPPLRDRIRMDRTLLRITSTMLIGGWIALGIALGPLNALWVLVLPLAVANFILMVYIGTQHWIRPRVDIDDPIVAALSVSVPRWMDVLHYRFSHHQEHHIFPSMSPRFAPMLRDKLREIEPEAVAVLPLRTAMRELLSTPTLYAQDGALARPDGSDNVDLAELSRRLNLPARF